MNINQLRQQRSAELKKMRTDKNVGKFEMSQLSGLHPATIYRIESGEVSWNIDTEIIYIETLKKINLQVAV